MSLTVLGWVCAARLRRHFSREVQVSEEIWAASTEAKSTIGQQLAVLEIVCWAKLALLVGSLSETRLS